MGKGLFTSLPLSERFGNVDTSLHLSERFGNIDRIGVKAVESGQKQ